MENRLHNESHLLGEKTEFSRYVCLCRVLLAFLLAANAQTQLDGQVLCRSCAKPCVKGDESCASHHPVKLDYPRVRYRILDRFGNTIFFCAPARFPQGLSPAAAKTRALKIFPEIEQDHELLEVMLDHLAIADKRYLSDDQKVLVVGEFDRLRDAILLKQLNSTFTFDIGVREKTQDFAIHGTVSANGDITVLSRTKTIFMCPVCLAEDTKVGTPHGPKFIKDLTAGMVVWSLDTEGSKIAVPVISVSNAIVLPMQPIVHLILRDGRELLASAGHPTADNRSIGELMAGSTYNGSVVDSSELIAYSGRRTYDILPGGPTGFYWANGVLVGSTLHSTKIPVLLKISDDVTRHK